MHRVVKVRFRNSTRTYFFDALDFDINKGDGLIVDTSHGNMLGEAVAAPEEMSDEKLTAALKPVIRKAEQQDYEQMEYYRSKEGDAMAACQQRINDRKLEMKLVSAEYAYNGSKLTFYFTADNRVDFRELLKDLTAIFKTRIDLRQIGDRDEAKKCGGLGFCGRPICCNSFLTEFTPVSIKMAKTQNLSLNPLKISGICGKLMCCLRYEQNSYEYMQKIMPNVGTEFMTPDGLGVVIENNVITETTKLKVALADGTFDVRSYPFRELFGCADDADCGACDKCRCKQAKSGEKREASTADNAEVLQEAESGAAACETEGEGSNGTNSAPVKDEKKPPRFKSGNSRMRFGNGFNKHNMIDPQSLNGKNE
ncbi:MAG: stage 0 sporulation protein [Clostridia bacterium]|nr:stage 0 sporulation protein [Clostridia bacterium]